jgi:hypothetical protein
VLDRMRATLASASTHSRWHWARPSSRLGSAVMALSVAALVVGAFGLGLSLRSQPHPTPIPAKTPSQATLPSNPTNPPATTTAPSTTAATPGAIASVRAVSVNFANASVGWVLGVGCDAQQRCAAVIARTNNGGTTWSLASALAGLDPYGPLAHITASSDVDAWVWGGDPSGRFSLSATHDGGRTWHSVNIGGASVVDVAVANGTVWAKTACLPASIQCTARLLSSPTHSGAWTDLGTLPSAVQGPVETASGPSGGLTRAGTRAWVEGSDALGGGIARTDDGGHTWVNLTVPCQFPTAEIFLAASSTQHLMLVCTLTGALPAPQEVWSSVDGGDHWALESREWLSQLSPPLPDVGHIDSSGYPTGLIVVDQTTAWMWQGREDDLVTHDDGRTWAHAALPQNYFGGGGGAEGLTFTDPLHGWTFTSAGMWHTTDGGVHWQYQPVIGRVPGS